MALSAMAIFAWAFGENPDDKILLGAIIGGFNLALGYFLGSSSKSGTPAKTEITNTEDNPVPTIGKDDAQHP